MISAAVLIVGTAIFTAFGVGLGYIIGRREERERGKARKGMGKRTTFMLTEAEYAELLRLSIAARSSPVILIGDYCPAASAHDDVQREWERLGRAHGFRPLTVEPGATKLEITAEPVEPEDSRP